MAVVLASRCDLFCVCGCIGFRVSSEEGWEESGTIAMRRLLLGVICLRGCICFLVGSERANLAFVVYYYLLLSDTAIEYHLKVLVLDLDLFKKQYSIIPSMTKP